MSCRPADISHDTAVLKHQQHGGVKTVFSDSKHLKGTVKGCFISLNIEGKPRYKTTTDSVFFSSKMEHVVKCNTYYMLDVRESVHRDTIMKITNKMQLYRLIYFSLSPLHVSGDVFAQHQKQLTVFTVSGSVHPGCCRLLS